MAQACKMTLQQEGRGAPLLGSAQGHRFMEKGPPEGVNQEHLHRRAASLGRGFANETPDSGIGDPRPERGDCRDDVCETLSTFIG